jgi:hypothetical protein
LTAVEDEYSGVPGGSDQSLTKGRMYPPDERFRYAKWERAGVRCYLQTVHATFVGDNGSIEIRQRKEKQLGEIVFAKPGKDGRKISDDPTQ